MVNPEYSQVVSNKESNCTCINSLGWPVQLDYIFYGNSDD